MLLCKFDTKWPSVDEQVYCLSLLRTLVSHICLVQHTVHIFTNVFKLNKSSFTTPILQRRNFFSSIAHRLCFNKMLHKHFNRVKVFFPVRSQRDQVSWLRSDEACLMNTPAYDYLLYVKPTVEPYCTCECLRVNTWLRNPYLSFRKLA